MNTNQFDSIIPYNNHPLHFMFAPKNVALIGATEKPNSVGRTLLWNLISNPFGGTVYPVNPKRHSVLGIRAYKSLTEIPEQIELVIIATPAITIPTVIKECVNNGVKGVIIISAGFKEIGAEGFKLEQEIITEARKGNIRIIGPNCLGLMSPISGLNATFAGAMAQKGNVGFISQSGAFCTSILDWSFQENIGFSAFISIGSMIDVNWGDLIYYLGDDPYTKSIVIYMESIGNARAFLSAAREVALTKPIIVIKGGRTQEAALAASSHTGALTGSDEVLAAAFRRCGVLQVDTINEIFDMAELLSKQPRPQGKKLTIITNAGGPGVLATDALTFGNGKLAPLSDETIAKLNEILPSHWSHSNPIDILGDATPERYAKTLEIAANDSNSDGLLVILTPQDMTDPTQTAIALKTIASEIKHKPILASWMGGNTVKEGEKILNEADIFTESYPDDAVRLFNLMWKSNYNLRGLYETPALPAENGKINRQQATDIINKVRNSGRTLLTEFEAKNLLSAYGIPTVVTKIAFTEEEAINIANQFTSEGEANQGVVLKLYSETITHKTDVGGVKLNLRSPTEIIKAFQEIKKAVNSEDFLGVTVQPMIKLDGYELIIGSSIDAQFGPVLLFGTGGQLVEVFQDRSLALPPLNTTLAKRMMEQTKIYKALKGVRGQKSVDLEQLQEILVTFSQLIVENKLIKELDINPLLASVEGFIALDARVLLHPLEIDVNCLPSCAIRPYPNQYVNQSQLANQTEIIIRPIRPEDEPLVLQFARSLSQETIYCRYFHFIKTKTLISHERLARKCFIDYDQEIGIVATPLMEDNEQPNILAIARLNKLHGNNQEAELGLIVSDDFHRLGIGSKLVKQCLEIASKENIKLITAYILPENQAMINLCQKLGFQWKKEDDLIKATYSINND